MKIIAVGLIFCSVLWCVRIYIRELEEQLIYFKDWEKIFRAWSEWLERFSISVDELIEQTATNPITCELSMAKQMQGHTIQEISSAILGRKGVVAWENEVILEVLQNIGNSMIGKEIESLDYAVNNLQKIILDRQNILKERKKLLYKLTPLLCGGLTIILW